jgi:hypothetical protein
MAVPKAYYTNPWLKELVNRDKLSWACAHPRTMKMGYHTAAAAQASSRCLGTRESLLSLTWERSAPRFVAFEHAERSRVRGGLSEGYISTLRRRSPRPRSPSP